MDPLKHPLIQSRQKELDENLQRITSAGFKPQKFCLMPFVNIILEPNGSVGLCRHKGTEHSLGSLKDQTWKEIWSGESAKAWRREFLTGLPKTCTAELEHQNCNLCPQLGKMFPKENLEHTFKEDVERPLRLTANFNGQCNLQCQMCDVWQLPNGFYTEENFWSQAREELFPYLKEIDMLSGEPFLQEDTYKLIDEVSATNPSCLWSITTNAHWRFNKKIKDALDKVIVKNIILSVDSFNEETYAKIRYPGKLSLVLENIERLRDYEKERLGEGKSPLNFNLNFLVQKDNWREIPQAISYCLERNIHPFLTFCYVPKEHSLLSFSCEQRQEIAHHLISTLNWGELCLSHRIISPLLSSLPPIDKAFLLDKMVELRKTYEKNQSHEN